GNGTVSTAGGVLQNAPITWKARTQPGETDTSPEELIAAAHAACYAMALSAAMTRGGNPPEHLDVTAEVTASLGDSGLSVSKSALTVRGRVPGIDQAAFEEWAKKGEEGCPVSKALRGNVEITVQATLES